MSLLIGDRMAIPFQANQTDVLAPTSCEMLAPFDGFVSGLFVTVQVAVGTGGVVKVVKGASTDVVGASVTVADSATKGTTYSAYSTGGNSSRAVTKGQRIQVDFAAAFNTTGALNGFVEFSTGQ